MKDFILPDIGEGIVECELLEWLVKEGDVIEEDQPIAEVMTDKATVQIPAMYAGKVAKLYYKTGDIAKVHAPLFAMHEDSDDSPSQAVRVEQSAVVSEAAEVCKPVLATSNTEDFILPDIGEGIVECEVVKWLISEGDMIEEDQPVVEVMTDKALVEIPAKYSGQVTQLYYAQGDIAKVHSPLYALVVEGEAAAMQSPSTAANSTHKDTSTPLIAQNKAQKTQGNIVAGNGKALASPAVRRLARENNLQLGQVSGSGKKGRVLKQDIQQHLSELPSSNDAPRESRETNAHQVEKSGTRVVPIKGIKAAMARQMSNSAFTIPHFSVSEEVNMDELIKVRTQLKAEFAAKDVKLSFMPFFIKAMSMALKAFPVINSQVNEDCTELTYFDDHNIGLAVDSKIGLLVPNIKQVQTLSLFEVAQEVNRLIDLAREGKLGNSDLKGGTISISNIGVLGGTTATPVINKPEAAIVALGKMQRLPRFDADDNVVAVNIMHVSWSGDHRIIDGATMVKFNNLWKSYLENPLSMLTDLR
ncbi:dihydrolipoyllysine-residue acetyltransferase [Aliiglaciecola sp. LCG003]|uniref:dihydrolipoyllysine-residue acetyltransferase n=1 Tax=Aliiglaciecola sp. LCG003 TaxID=3053655 RepID=UPI002572A8FA|nr:dihydrolipoyllysine-residue acetyltransferase [Aliiglaciecola sp. LCG003]WJG07671.1 dihydrolipoyllysine-residue acetyltransferase [Aliiglaciecola sp. LCG003]